MRDSSRIPFGDIIELVDVPPNPSSKPPCRRDDALAVLKRLRQAGHVAYFAGGCVRDMLLKLEPKDWDIATDATPEQVRTLFTSTQSVGAAFGVMLVRHGASVVEVAMFRADAEYKDGRRPTGVTQASPEMDAQRRDFTINGLFFDPMENRVIDFVAGRPDLDAKILRAIGDPRHRFAEDHLRLLRAVRFAARFSLSIDPGTSEAIRVTAESLKGISPERVGEESRLMLTPPTRIVAWKLLWELNLAPVIFRFLQPPPKSAPADDVFARLAPGIEITFGLALAAANLSAAGTKHWPDNKQITQWVRAMRQALRISNAESNEMFETLSSIATLLQPSLGVATLKRFLAMPTSTGAQLLLLAALSHAPKEKILAELKKLEGQQIAPPPFLTGDDLVAAGFSPGPKFKEILAAVYDAQLEDRVKSRDEALEMARKL